MKFAIFLKSSLLFNSFYFFLFINKILGLNNLKTRSVTNAKISVLVIGVEAIIYLLLYNLHDCTFKKIDFEELKKLFNRRKKIPEVLKLQILSIFFAKKKKKKKKKKNNPLLLYMKQIKIMKETAETDDGKM